MGRAENREQMAEVRGRRAQIRKQRSEIEGQKSESTDSGKITFTRLFIGILILTFGIASTGCVSEPTRTYSGQVVRTYAELTLLYEKEKMTNKLTDSTYQLKVNEFFRGKSIDEAVFKKGIEEFSRNEGVWKLFIQDVSAAMDSLKAAGK